MSTDSCKASIIGKKNEIAIEIIKTISMKKNSKVIVLERNRFAMLVKVHRKSLLMLEVLTYICRIRNIDLVMTLEEVCHVLRMDAAVVEQHQPQGGCCAAMRKTGCVCTRLPIWSG